MTDHSLARRNLVANFRSVTVFPGSDPETGRLTPHIDVLARWLSEYQQAYFTANAQIHEGRLHALGGRMLMLTGDHVLLAFEEVRRLGKIAAGYGTGFLLAVSLDGVARHRLAMATLRSAVPNLQFQIDCTSMKTSAPDAVRQDYRRALLEHVRSGGELRLVGALEDIRAAGLLECEEFNSTFISLSAPHTSQLRPVHRPHRFAPCRDFIGMYIGPGGDIYPCAGMVGHAPATLGSIESPFDDLLETLASTHDGITALSVSGPRVIAVAQDYPGDLCALHRRSLEDLAAL